MTFQIACVHTHLGDLYTGYLDEAEYDVKNYVGQGDCYLPRSKLFLPTPALFLKLPGCTKPDAIIVLLLIRNLTKKLGKCYLDAKVRSKKTFPISRQFQDMKGSLFWRIYVLLQMSTVSDIFVYSCNNFESVVRLIRFRITCEIFGHFLLLCTAMTAEPLRRMLVHPLSI